jgi:uncharacterized protein (DUF1499 family)
LVVKGPWFLLPVSLTVLLFVASPLLARLHVVTPLHGFLAFVASVLPGIVAVALGLYLIAGGARDKGALCLIVGLAPLVVIGFGIARARQLPTINDITTNLDNPPNLTTAAQAPENQGKDLSYPSEFKAQVQESYPGLISLQLALPAEAAFQLARQVAEGNSGWHLTRIDPVAMILEGEDTSGIFQFTDDFVIRVMALDTGTQIDMRSRSRVGKGDFGANARRIRDYFAQLEAAQPKNGATDR